MSATKVPGLTSETSVRSVDMKLEVQIIPVSDVDRSRGFYERLGWRLDDDAAPLDGLRIVQFTPPGSGTSVTFGKGLTTAPPGSAEGGLVVSDIEAAHDRLVGRGIDVSDVWHGPPFPPEARQPGPDPERTSYRSFFSFNDPDGNLWLVQEVTVRLPGRIAAGLMSASKREHPDQMRIRSSEETTMIEFLVQFEVDIPSGVAESEVEDRKRAEAAAAETLADEGHLVRLWQASVGTGRTTVLGLYRARSKTELDELLVGLPLYEWMRTSITPLFQHPNDPAAIRAIA